MACAIKLHALNNSGTISDLKEQVKIELTPKIGKVRAAYYVADFEYLDGNGSRVLADAKGHKTQLYELKKKMVLHRYGILVQEL